MPTPIIKYASTTKAVLSVLDVIGTDLLADTTYSGISSGVGKQLLSKVGRQASTFFEASILTPYVVTNSEALALRIQETLDTLPADGVRFRFIGIEFPPKTEDSGKDLRPGMDFWVTLESREVGSDQIELIKQMVNVKYTMGSSSANTAGVPMMAWALRGELDKRRGESKEGMVANVAATLEEFEAIETDYYFLTFIHSGGPKRTKIADRHSQYSLLGLDPEKYLNFNSSQPFPSIQINYSKAQQTTLESITAARRRLLTWWINHALADYAEKVDSLNSMAASLGVMQRIDITKVVPATLKRRKKRGRTRGRNTPH